MIHSWDAENPVMVYSDQLILIDVFQRHFENMWQKSNAGTSKRHAIATLTELKNQCAKHIQQA